MFSEHGFTETTARQIAAVVGVSERTFFRYFASKEDVVLGVLDDLGIELAARLAARPTKEAPFIALRRSFDLMTETLTENPEWSLTMLQTKISTSGANQAAIVVLDEVDQARARFFSS